MAEAGGHGLTGCSPHYISPELYYAIFGSIAYGKGVDMWALGVLAFKLMFGQYPFGPQSLATLDDRNQLFLEIQHGDPFSPLPLPSREVPLPDPALSIMKQLLTKDPAARLGAQGEQEVFDHPFFNGINWDDVANLRLQPVFVPGTPNCES